MILVPRVEYNKLGGKQIICAMGLKPAVAKLGSPRLFESAGTPPRCITSCISCDLHTGPADFDYTGLDKALP